AVGSGPVSDTRPARRRHLTGPPPGPTPPNLPEVSSSSVASPPLRRPHTTAVQSPALFRHAARRPPAHCGSYQRPPQARPVASAPRRGRRGGELSKALLIDSGVKRIRIGT